MRRILLQTPYQFDGGTAIYQQWVKSFDPMCLLGLFVPTWISFPLVLLEYYKLAWCTTWVVGTVLGEDGASNTNGPPRFYVGLDVAQGWVSAVVVDSRVGGNVVIPVQYDSILLKCSIYGSHVHPIEQCARNIPVPQVPPW
jgi:hypothetical protein